MSTSALPRSEVLTALSVEDAMRRSLSDSLHAVQAGMDTQPQWTVYAVLDPLLGEVDAPLFDSAVKQAKIPWSMQFADLATTQKPYLLSEPKGNEHARSSFVHTFVERAVAECWQPRRDDGQSPRYWCALLHTPHSSDELRVMLGRAASVIDTQGRRRMLRYWDPRVTQHLQQYPMLTTQFTPGYRGLWGYVDSFGQWHWLDRSGEGDHLQSTALRRMSESEQALLSDCSQLNALHEAADGVRTLSDLNDDRRWSWLRECLQAAQTAGLVEPLDIQAFVARRCQYRVPIEHTERLRTLLHDVRQHQLSYRAVQAELGDDEWRQIASQAQTRSLHP